MVGNRHQVNFQHLFALQDKPEHYILHLVQCQLVALWFPLLCTPAKDGISFKISSMRHTGTMKLNMKSVDLYTIILEGSMFKLYCLKISLYTVFNHLKNYLHFLINLFFL